jgi:tetratricopeptide (TPR) repeat protein
MTSEKVLQGDQLFSQGDTEAALNCYLDALFMADPTAALFVKIAHCNKVTGELENALEYYEKALELEGDNAEALFNAGECLFSLDRPEEGLAFMDRVISACGEAAGSIGELARQRKNQVEASRLNRAGGALLKEGRMDEAREAFEQAIALNPSDERNYANLGVVFVKSGDIAGGIEWMRKAIEVNPAYVRGYYNLGTLLLRTGYYRQATDIFSRALEAEPDGRDSNDIRTNLQVAEENLRACGAELSDLLKGVNPQIDNQQVTTLLNGIAEEAVSSVDIIFSHAGSMKCIAYGQSKKWQVSPGPEGELPVMQVLE